MNILGYLGLIFFIYYVSSITFVVLPICKKLCGTWWYDVWDQVL